MTREDAITLLKNIQNGIDETNFLDRCAIDMAIEALKEQKQGKWEFVGDNCFMCKTCGYVADANWLREWRTHTDDSEYPTACPNCGARMRGDEK